MTNNRGGDHTRREEEPPEEDCSANSFVGEHFENAHDWD
jgi:hypothetical protein